MDAILPILLISLYILIPTSGAGAFPSRSPTTTSVPVGPCPAPAAP